MRPWFPPFAKDAKFFAGQEVKIPALSLQEPQGQGRGTRSGAKARVVFCALRGAEAAALPRYSEAFGTTTGEVKNNIKVKSGASGVRGFPPFRKGRERMGHPFLMRVR
jgi:hypothetical protein